MSADKPVAAPRLVAALAALGTAYAAALALASRTTSASLWGIHHAAFLTGAPRAFVLACAAAGAALLVASAVRRARRESTAPAASRRPRGSAARHGPSVASVLPLYALPVLAALFWALRVRTHFLGDGIVWLANLTSGQFPRFSEPLATEVWHGYVRLLHALGLVADAGSLATLSIACGLIAAALLWRLAREIAPGARSRLAAGILLLTLGVAQLGFGYIESYPIIGVLVVAYLVAGAHAARSGRLTVWPGIALALVAAAHVVSLALAPSYVWLVARAPLSWGRRALLLLGPPLLAAAIFALLNFSVADLFRPFHTMGEALQGGTGTFGFTARSLFTARHWLDLANLALLLAPAPLLLLGARAVTGRRTGNGGADPVLAFLAAAALPGLVATLFLVVPGSPAQDWDLLAIVLLPATAAVVAAGVPALERAPRAAVAGLAMLAAASLFSFVLVNADAAAGIRRFEALVGEGASLRPHERAYGNEKLATYWVDRGDYERALVHARRAVEAEPSNPRYWVKAGGALLSLGRHEEAVPFFTEALRRGPRRADAWYDLGICYAQANRYELAASAFRTAVALDGDRPDYRHNLGLMLYASGKPDSARLVWTEVLQRWEGYPLTVRSMARRFGSEAESTTAAAPIGEK